MAVHNYNGFKYLTKDKYNSVSEFISITKTGAPTPNRELYHYYSISNNGINAVLENYIFANHPYHFNDPYDCYADLISFDQCSLDEILELNDNIFEPEAISKLYKSNKPEDRRELRKNLNYIMYNVIYLKTGIFCMTDNIESTTMWSYYNNHQGFAVKYDTGIFPDTYWGPFPINYTDTFEPIDYRIFKRASFIYQSNIKAKCWEPEDEYRLIFYGPNTMKIPQIDTPNSHDRKFYINPKSIKEITLGFSFFSIKEINFTNSNEEVFEVILKNNKKLKRKLFNYFLKNNLPTSIIKIKDVGYGLKAYPIDIKPISSNNYVCKFK